MNKTIGFDGTYAQNVKKAKSFSRAFETLVDYDSESYYKSKKTYHHDEDEFSFDYNYFVKVEDLYDLSGDDEHKGKFFVELTMIPTKEYCNEKILSNVAQFNGCEIDEIRLHDIVDSGYGARIGYETIEKIYSWNSPKLSNTLNGIATVIDTIDSMRGFYLDNYENRIGTTGWDKLHEMIDGTDAINETMKRWRA